MVPFFARDAVVVCGNPWPSSTRLPGALPPDLRLCAAIADRLTFRFTLVETGIESSRLAATEVEHQLGC
ncbi:hypothetical protein KAURM247S_06391 [Kitasatospora aureofaciens]|nr:hypothetical protein CP971_34360 [Streptomyces viridifaciens]